MENKPGTKPDEPFLSVEIVVNNAAITAMRVKITSQGAVVNARAFAKIIPGLDFYPLTNPPAPGMALQYGNKISFVCEHFSSGFCSLKEIPMEPPLVISNDIFWTPLDFLAEAVSGNIELDVNGKILSVTLTRPFEIGDRIETARDIARQLRTAFHVRQGEIGLADAISMFTAGYTPDCNGNNAANPYLVVQNPPSPRTDRLNRVPFGVQMDQDEAFLWVGETPPECRYFSYQHYLMTRFFNEEEGPVFKKIYARIGDSVNLCNPAFNTEPFGRFFVLIITGNQDVHDEVINDIEKAKIPRDKILSLVLPNNINFGLTLTSDVLNFLHRATLFSQEKDKEKYIQCPPLEILRITPREKNLLFR